MQSGSLPEWGKEGRVRIIETTDDAALAGRERSAVDMFQDK